MSGAGTPCMILIIEWKCLYISRLITNFIDVKNGYKFTSLIFITLFTFSLQLSAQNTSKKVRDVHKAYTDSLKAVKYDYVFPFLGQGAYKKGFDIPYPMGIMLNYFWTDMGITIENLQLGFQNAYKPENSFQLQPVVDEEGNEILGFGDSRNTSYSVNVRPDIWVFSFLNVYGIFGYGHSHTEVKIDKLGEHNIDFTLVVDQKISTAGFGVLVAGGIGPVWISGDFNFTWNKPELLDKATLANVMGLRMGHVFIFKQKPYRNISIWVGAMRIKMQSTTVGKIPMRDAIPQDVWDNKDQFVDDYYYWYDNEATPVQKKLADRVLTPIVEGIDGREGESIVEYGIDKQVAQMWNGLVGFQFQLNKSWQFRAEAGLLGDRKSALASINYRILGFKRKH